MPDKVIQSAATADRIEFTNKTATMEIANKIGIKNAGLLDAADIKKIDGLMKTSKKPVEFVISFNAGGFSYFAKVGSTKIPISSLVIAADPRIADKDQVYKNLITYQAATQDLVNAHKKANPDQKELAALKTQITELETKIKADQTKLAALKKQHGDLGGK